MARYIVAADAANDQAVFINGGPVLYRADVDDAALWDAIVRLVESGGVS